MIIDKFKKMSKDEIKIKLLNIDLYENKRYDFVFNELKIVDSKRNISSIKWSLFRNINVIYSLLKLNIPNVEDAMIEIMLENNLYDATFIDTNRKLIINIQNKILLKLLQNKDYLIISDILNYHVIHNGRYKNILFILIKNEVFKNNIKEILMNVYHANVYINYLITGDNTFSIENIADFILNNKNIKWDTSNTLCLKRIIKIINNDSNNDISVKKLESVLIFNKIVN